MRAIALLLLSACNLYAGTTTIEVNAYLDRTAIPDPDLKSRPAVTPLVFTLVKTGKPVPALPLALNDRVKVNVRPVKANLLVDTWVGQTTTVTVQRGWWSSKKIERVERKPQDHVRSLGKGIELFLSPLEKDKKVPAQRSLRAGIQTFVVDRPQTIVLGGGVNRDPPNFPGKLDGPPMLSNSAKRILVFTIRIEIDR